MLQKLDILVAMKYSFLGCLDQIDGGLGMAVTKLLATAHSGCRIGYIGIDDRFGQVGTVDFLVGEYNLSADDICSKVKSILK